MRSLDKTKCKYCNKTLDTKNAYVLGPQGQYHIECVSKMVDVGQMKVVKEER